MKFQHADLSFLKQESLLFNLKFNKMVFWKVYSGILKMSTPACPTVVFLGVGLQNECEYPLVLRQYLSNGGYVVYTVLLYEHVVDSSDIIY